MGQQGYVANDGVVRHTFETIATTGDIKSLVELNNLFRPVFAGLGFLLFAGIEVLGWPVSPSLNILFGEGFEAWQIRYEGMHYAIHDPIIPECLKCLHPFYWSDLITLGQLSQDASRVLEDAQTFGLEDGLVLPLHASGHDGFIVLLAGQHRRGERVREVAIHLLATHYGITGRRLRSSTRCDPQLSGGLTRRQCECLRWARAGKSSTDIGHILRISAGVVDEHIAAACERLGVRTRIQAVIAASKRGYLDN